VLELAQVAEVVVGGQALLPRPAQGFTQPDLGDPHPRLQRRYGTHVGVWTLDILALRLVEQIERTVQVSLGFLDSRHGNVPAIARLR
jgi:hypothetical protein